MHKIVTCKAFGLPLTGSAFHCNILLLIVEVVRLPKAEGRPPPRLANFAPLGGKLPHDDPGVLLEAAPLKSSILTRCPNAFKLFDFNSFALA